MESVKGKRAIEKLATQKGLSIREIKEEIEVAIEFAMNHPDHSIQQYWRNIPCKGKKPTAEEVIIHLANQLYK